MTQESILKNVVVFAPDLRAISGTVSKDTGAENGPAFTGGSVRYIDPETLTGLGTIRSRMARICRSMGVRFLSGWAVPEDAAGTLQALLAPTVEDARQAISAFLDKFEESKEQWLDDHPEIGPYQGRFPTIDDARARMGVSVAIYKIDNSVVANANPAEDGVLVELGVLPRRALEEIAQDVRTSWDPSRGVAGKKTLGIVHRIREKLRTLEFLGGNLGQAARLIEATLQRLPDSGKIEGTDYAILAALMGALERPDFLVSISSNLPDQIDPALLLGVRQAQAQVATLDLNWQAALPEEAPIQANQLESTAVATVQVEEPVEAWSW